MSRKIHLCGCHLGFKKFQIPCHKTNYLKSQRKCIYVLNISRILPGDILVFIADSTTRTLRTGMDDITGFLTPVTDYLM